MQGFINPHRFCIKYLATLSEKVREAINQINSEKSTKKATKKKTKKAKKKATKKGNMQLKCGGNKHVYDGPAPISYNRLCELVFYHRFSLSPYLDLKRFSLKYDSKLLTPITYPKLYEEMKNQSVNVVEIDMNDDDPIVYLEKMSTSIPTEDLACCSIAWSRNRKKEEKVHFYHYHDPNSCMVFNRSFPDLPPKTTEYYDNLQTHLKTHSQTNEYE